MVESNATVYLSWYVQTLFAIEVEGLTAYSVP